MKRINLKVLLILLVVVVGGLVGIVLLRRFQVARNAGSLAKLAKVRLEEGKSAEAMALYARYIGLRPEDHEAYGELAKLLLERAEAADATRSDMAKAYNVLETAVRRNPENDDLRRRLAEFQLRIGRAIDAREHLQVLRERIDSGTVTSSDADADGDDEDRKPLDANLVELLTAQSHLGGGDVEQASAIVAKMVGYDLDARRFQDVEIAKPTTEAYIILAAILEEKLDDRAAAAAVIRKLVETNATDVQAWLAKSSWHRQRGELPEAREAVDKAMELAPDDANPLFARFELALADQDLAAAEAVAEKARELFPSDERAYRGLASIAFQQGNPEKAEQILLDGISRLPGKASLLLMLADALLQQNKLEEVTQTIERIKELYGTGSPAVGLLESRVLVASRKWGEAKAMLEKVRPMVIGSPDLVRQVDLYLGQCHAQLDEYDAQLDVNRRVLSGDPSSLAARAGSAAALAAAGKTAEALVEFEAIAAALPPDRIPSVPQVWYPLLQLRIQDQMNRPAAERDWNGVDTLLDSLQQSPDVTPAQATLLRADVLVRKGEGETARELLEAAADEGGDPQLWAALATLALRQQGPEAATAILDRAPEAIVNSANLLAVRAQAVAGVTGDAGQAALADVESRAAGLPDDEAAGVLTLLAGLAFSRGDLESAERLWREVAQRRPDDIRPREALLEIAVGRGDIEQARAAAAEVATASGKDTPRARAAEAAVRIGEARKSITTRREAGETSAEPTSEEKKSLDDARNLLLEAEVDRPGWSQVQTLLAEIETLKGNLPAAIARLEKAVELGPANPAVTRRLVALLYSTNRIEEAQRAMESLGAAGEQGLERLSAEAELRAGRFDEAVAFAERSVSPESTNPDDLLWLGQVLARAGRGEQAGEALRRATEVAASRSDVWLALFSHQVATDQKTAAERTLTRACELLEDPRRQLTLAQGREMLGRLDDAEEAFRDAVRVAPDDLETKRGLAAFLVRCGRLEPARETLRTMLASADSSPAAADAKAWARRTLAELIAGRGSFTDMQEAMKLLQENADSKGEMAAEDIALRIKLLTDRPEPASWKQAISLLEDFGRRQPLTIGQRIVLAQLQEKVGNWEECRNQLVSVVAGPRVPPAYVAMLIEKMIDHGEVGAARPWLARLQKMSPQSAITIALEAKMAIAQNDRKLAAEAARKLMPGGVVPGNDPGQLDAIARLMEQLGFPKAADKVFASYAEASVDGVAARAEFLGRQQRAEEAIDLLDSRWNDLPLERLLTTGVQVVRCQESPAATAARIEPWFAKAKRLDPGSIVIRLLEAELLNLQGRPDDAEATYRRLLDSSDLTAVQKAIVSNNLAFHLARPETAGEATKLIDQAIAELGPLPDLLDTRGMVRLAAGQPGEAVADLREAILQPTEIKFLHLAIAQLKNGDEAEARKALEAGRRRGLAMSRLSPDDRQRLGELESALGIEEPTALDPQG